VEGGVAGRIIYSIFVMSVNFLNGLNGREWMKPFILSKNQMSHFDKQTL
jgi:hypothetical protein